MIVTLGLISVVVVIMGAITGVIYLTQKQVGTEEWKKRNGVS